MRAGSSPALGMFVIVAEWHTHQLEGLGPERA